LSQRQGLKSWSETPKPAEAGSEFIRLQQVYLYQPEVLTSCGWIYSANHEGRLGQLQSRDLSP
jgi:hypothetical protein